MNIGRVVVKPGVASVSLRILHEELGREAFLTLREAKALRDEIDKAIAAAAAPAVSEMTTNSNQQEDVFA